MTANAATEADTPARRLRDAPYLAVIFLDSLSYALVLPLLPFILAEHGAGASAGGLLVAAHAIMAACSAPILGIVSDRIGRRPVILGTLAGAVLAYGLFAISPNLILLFMSRALAGAMAGNIGVVQAAIAEGHAPSDRTRAMGRMTATWALGFVVGPAVSAALPVAERSIALWPGVLAGVVTLLAMLVVAADRQRVVSVATAKADQGAVPGMPVLDRGTLIGLFGTLAIAQTGLVAMTGFWASRIFGWGPREVSLLFLASAAAIVLFQLAVLPRLSERFSETRLLKGFLVLGVGCCAAVVAGPGTAAILAVAGSLLFCAITGAQTVCTACLSRATSSRAQGAVLGGANGVAAICRVAAPILCGTLFELVRPEAPYYLVAVLFLVWLGLLGLRAARPMRSA